MHGLGLGSDEEEHGLRVLRGPSRSDRAAPAPIRARVPLPRRSKAAPLGKGYVPFLDGHVLRKSRCCCETPSPRGGMLRLSCMRGPGALLAIVAGVTGCALIGYDPQRFAERRDAGQQTPEPPTTEGGRPFDATTNDNGLGTNSASDGGLDGGGPPASSTADGSLPPTRPAAPEQVTCDTRTCSLTAGELCCVTALPNYPLVEGAYSCQPAGPSCETQLGCDSSDDCPVDQQCCLDRSATPPASTCETSCSPLGTTVLECSSPSDCPNESVCCALETLSFGVSTRYSALRCMDTCSATVGNVFCLSDTDCVVPGTACRPSNQIPGHTVCRTADTSSRWW